MDAQLRRLSSSALLLLTLALWPAVAAADTRTDARRYFNRGMEAIQEGRTREGIELLIQAYEIKPHPHVLFNVARAYASVNEVDLAIEYFEKYLTVRARHMWLSRDELSGLGHDAEVVVHPTRRAR